MVKKVFLCGIAGTGMSALAGLFKEKGYRVFGSDAHFYPPVDGLLKKLRVTLCQGYAPANIPADVDFCVIGNVVGRGNPEVEFILDRHIEYFSMAEALQRFFIKGRESLVVAGSHGKTTTASFIAHMLAVAGLRPGFFIGGKPLNFDANFGWGGGEHFVIEGDEYETAFFDRTAKFFKYRPDRLIITALEHDHLDFYPHAAGYLKSFRDLVNQVPGRGTIIVNRDYEMAGQAVSRAFTPVISYGERRADYVISDRRVANGGYDFRLVGPDWQRSFHAPLAGSFNVWNLTAGIILGSQLRLPWADIEKALASFRGVERRLTVLGRAQGTVFIEDFAHHPTAISQVLRSLPELYPGHRVLAIFEPRSWSLRRGFFQEQLPASLAAADEIMIKDVYEKDRIAAAERLDVERVKKDLQKRGKKVTIFERYEHMQQRLEAMDLALPRVVILLSNGDVHDFTEWARALSVEKKSRRDRSD
jgi:UDP-N-acetylmuramate: L-alanyl-gamma-D-glutamyl-meso-diaminopimelate ligase